MKREVDDSLVCCFPCLYAFVSEVHVDILVYLFILILILFFLLLLYLFSFFLVDVI